MRTSSKRELLRSRVGTPDYTAPEVLSRDGYGKECDFWSVGIILFESLAGFPPFRAKDTVTTHAKILAYQALLPRIVAESCSHLSREAKDIIRLLLSPAEVRLGRNRGMSEILAHPWFRGFDWRNIRKMKPPYVPSLAGADDTSCFEDVTIIRKAMDSLLSSDCWSPTNRKYKATDIPFIGYTFCCFPSQDTSGQTQEQKTPQKK